MSCAHKMASWLDFKLHAREVPAECIMLVAATRRIGSGLHSLPAAAAAVEILSLFCRAPRSAVDFFTGGAVLLNAMGAHSIALEMMDAMQKSSAYIPPYFGGWSWTMLLVLPHSIAVNYAFPSLIGSNGTSSPKAWHNTAWHNTAWLDASCDLAVHAGWPWDPVDLEMPVLGSNCKHHYTILLPAHPRAIQYTCTPLHSPAIATVSDPKHSQKSLLLPCVSDVPLQTMCMVCCLSPWLSRSA
jgi:hypothetical protein